MTRFETLARRRYPDVPVGLAVQMLLSDRHAAGLGALDERKRQPPGRPGWGCVKYIDVLGAPGHVLYKMRFYRPRGWAAVSPELAPKGRNAAALEVQRRVLPEVGLAARHCCDLALLHDQAGRDATAAALRKLRRELRAAVLRETERA